MRGPNSEAANLEPEILKILEESEVPMSTLGVNFRVNAKFDKIVELNAVKRQLESLVKSKKLVRLDKDDMIFYRINNKAR